MLYRATPLIIAASLAVTSAGGVAKEAKQRASALKGQLILYKGRNYNGEAYLIEQSQSVVELDWNIGSIGIGPDTRFEICAKPRFKAPCMPITESIPDASTVGINGGIGSARPMP